MRKKIIAANWKMHKTLQEALTFVAEVTDKKASFAEVDGVICASPLFLSALVAKTKGTNVNIGAQNMYFANEGAYTGEVSPNALADLGVTYVIIGHSERRELFGETDEGVNKKVQAAFAHNLIPIVCCGETLAERANNETNAIVKKQVSAALQGLSNDQVKQVVIAYEPIWAIGTGKSSTPTDANAVCEFIRNVIATNFATETANKIRIQYGGSVKAENISSYLNMEHIDGALVGGASLEAKSYLQLLEAGKDG